MKLLRRILVVSTFLALFGQVNAQEAALMNVEIDTLSDDSFMQSFTILTNQELPAYPSIAIYPKDLPVPAKEVKPTFVSEMDLYAAFPFQCVRYEVNCVTPISLDKYNVFVVNETKLIPVHVPLDERYIRLRKSDLHNISMEEGKSIFQRMTLTIDSPEEKIKNYLTTPYNGKQWVIKDIKRDSKSDFDYFWPVQRRMILGGMQQYRVVDFNEEDKKEAIERGFKKSTKGFSYRTLSCGYFYHMMYMTKSSRKRLVFEDGETTLIFEPLKD